MLSAAEPAGLSSSEREAAWCCPGLCDRLSLGTTAPANPPSALAGEVFNLSGVHVEHDTASTGVAVGDGDRGRFLRIDLLAGQIRDENRFLRHFSCLLRSLEQSGDFTLS